MRYSIKPGLPHKQRTACVVVGVFAKRRLSEAAKQLDEASGGHLGRVLRHGDMDGDKGRCLLMHDVPGIQARRVLLIGCGKAAEFGERAYQDALALAARTLDQGAARDMTCYLPELEVKERDYAWRLRQAVIACADALYRFDEMKSRREPPTRPLEKIVFGVQGRSVPARLEQALAEGQAIAEGMHLARDLANLPGNVCTPTYLAEQARDLGKRHRRVKVEILEEKDMEKLGMGALLSVSRGSRQPARLIVMRYQGAARNVRPVVLVGKGLTFDAGGISLKPAQAMDEMKYDMCGGASVFGALEAVAGLGLPVNVIGVVPSSENLPDGQANKPGDIVTSMSGQTIEILNTDAEGRLILCDALTYSKRFEPDTIIDIATLTGACVIGLGKHASGLMGNHEGLVHDLLEAGQEAHDRAWQLPLWEEYDEQLKSPFADMANIGGREGGAITAGCFLGRFTKGQRWAHLDIAGTAWLSGASKGATGRPVPLLTQYLIRHSRRKPRHKPGKKA